MRSILLLATVALFGLSNNLHAEPVEDNSFLIEEAYNQEEGVVQFINVFKRNSKTKDWDYTFINEIPVFSQAHQFSYEIPLSHLGEANKTIISDVKFNYRREFFRNDKVVSTGRVSLFTPTGKYKEGTGSGKFSPEISLINSVIVSDKWVQHWNIGAGYIADAKDALGNVANNTNLFAGVSNVVLITDQFNFMLETLFSSSEATVGNNLTEWGTSVVVSPSLRMAIDYKNWQFVPGIAIPLGVGPQDKGSVEFLGYLSIEGKMF